MIRLRFPRYILLFFLMVSVAASGADAPRRIVSLSLCTDELVLRLAPREHIASLSYLAADPRYSAFAGQTEGLHLNGAHAEEVIDLEPDLILSSRFSASAAVSLLRRLGHPVTVLDFPATFEDAYAQIREVAGLVGEPERGEALIRRMQETVDGARRRLAGHEDALALFYDSNGISYGHGTLRDYFLQSLGWRNLAAEAGLSGPAPLALERLVAGRPDYLLVDAGPTSRAPLAHRMLRHPAVQRSVPDERVLVMPDRLFQCAGPALADAYTRLARQLPEPAPGDSGAGTP